MKRAAVLCGVLAGGAATLWAPPARAQTRGCVTDQACGEARSILRDGDRLDASVAGEGNAASTVVNAAALGWLRAASGIFDATLYRKDSRRRGDHLGAFFGVPLFPGRILALGLGYQFFMAQRASGAADGADDNFNKTTVSLAVPLVRWVPGVSVGASYSRLFSRRNQHADGIGQWDVGASWHANRFVAFGFVARGLNQPVARDVRHSVVLDPEVALRPFGSRAFEVAGGVRYSPYSSSEDRFNTFRLEPRGRVAIGGGGLRFLFEAERYRDYPADLSGGAQPRQAVRFFGGVQLDLPRVGVAAAPAFSARGAGEPIDGAAMRLRISKERYDSFAIRPRHVVRIDLGGKSSDRDLWRVVEQLDQLAERRATVLLDLRLLGYGWAQIEELREAVLRVRARGGRVVAYLEGGGLRTTLLAGAADRVVAHPNTAINILGLRSETLYFAGLLEKLGAKSEFVRIAEYKGAAELYAQPRATEPVRRQRRQLLTDIWNHVVRATARDRGMQPKSLAALIDKAPLAPEAALSAGLVDALAYPDALDDDLEKWLGRAVRIAPASKAPKHDNTLGPGAKIAVVYIEGDLLDGASVEIPLLGRRIAGADSIAPAIEKLSADPLVRAIVVRLDTPGGSVSAADRIARALDVAREKKPVVASFGNASASGGYYIATGAQYIFADATTITGSIGIFYPKVDLSGFFDKVGVTVDSEQYGRFAGLRSWYKPYTDEERAQAQADIQRSYEIFTGRVAQARSMQLERVDTVARGRVFTGVRGIDEGIVDSYGGLREAIARAESMAGLKPGRAAITHWPAEPGLLDRIRALFGIRLPNPLATSGVTVPVFTPIVGVLAKLPASLWMGQPGAQALAESEVVVLD